MLLFVNGIYKGVKCAHVGYWISDYESAFELLTKLVTDNWALQEATIVDGRNRLEVPIKAIDGEPIQAHIRTLQRQWQFILNSRDSTLTDPLSVLTQNQLKNWYLHLDAYYVDMLDHLEKMITSLEKRKSLLLIIPSNESLRLLVNDQYDSLLKSNKRMYRKTRKDRQENIIRLQRINNDPSIR